MSDRDPRGRFNKGCKGGPGRPPRVTEDDYLLALSDALTPDRWQRIVDRAIQDAENGDDKARAWLSSHILPRAGSGRLGAIDADKAREERAASGEPSIEDLLRLIAQ